MYCCRNQETLEFEQLDPETEQYVDSDFRLPKNQRHYLWQDEEGPQLANSPSALQRQRPKRHL
jgi:hypothetical protein